MGLAVLNIKGRCRDSWCRQVIGCSTRAIDHGRFANRAKKYDENLDYGGGLSGKSDGTLRRGKKWGRSLRAAGGKAPHKPRSLVIRASQKNGLSKIRDYGVIWSDILIPLVSEAVCVAIEEQANGDDVQFIPAIIRSSGEAIDGSYFLLNPTRKVDVTDHDASEPIVVKIAGFPDAKVGFKKMVLGPDFPANGIGRQYDSPTYIVVGDQLADAVLRATKNGVRFTTGIPPAG